jgi:uncharacterized membrane protein HdeD (DUF308 family)
MNSYRVRLLKSILWIASVGTLVAVISLALYGVVGFIVLMTGSTTLSYPLLMIDKDPVLNSLLSVSGTCMSIIGFTLIIFSANVDTSRADRWQLILYGIVVGSLGLAILRVSLPIVV